MKRQDQAGFTLIELLITLAIIAIVAAIAVISLISALDKARQRATMADMKDISLAIEAYIEDHDRPPEARSAEDLIRALTPQYSKTLPLTDHWANGYTYRSDPSGTYTLESYGKDGAPGANITLATRFDYELDIVMANGKFVAAPE